MHVLVTCKYKKGSDQEQPRKGGHTIFPIHVGLFETYRYKRTGQIFIWNYVGNWYVFFSLNISIIIADINTVQFPIMGND